MHFRKILKSVENYIIDYQSVTKHKFVMSEEKALFRRLLKAFDTQSQKYSFTQPNHGVFDTQSEIHSFTQLNHDNV